MENLNRQQRLALRKKLARVLNVDLEKVPEDFDENWLSNQLGIDSLDVVELILQIEEEYD